MVTLHNKGDYLLRHAVRLMSYRSRFAKLTRTTVVPQRDGSKIQMQVTELAEPWAERAILGNLACQIEIPECGRVTFNQTEDLMGNSSRTNISCRIVGVSGDIFEIWRCPLTLSYLI